MVQQKLIKYICEEIHMMEPDAITSEEDLLESDLLDSMGVMRLVAFIEGEFSVSVAPQDLTVENFSTIQNIESLIIAKSESIGSEINEREQ